jgi:hypothetical protein
MTLRDVRVSKTTREPIPDLPCTAANSTFIVDPHQPAIACETEKTVARKTKETKPEVVGLIGVGFDHQDEHQRITEGDDFFLVGGSEETHERMQDVAIHVTESLKNKGKRLQDACAEEVIELMHKAMDR